MATLKQVCQDSADQRPEEGKVVADRYRLKKKLGSGGGGSVWLADDKQDGQVALKLLGLFSSRDKHAIEMLKSEFSILKDLNHPYIYKIFDFGVDDLFGAYFITEHIDQAKDIFTATTDMSFEDCEKLFVQLLRSLAYIHSRGITHFDIKCANILVRESERVTLIDFGIAAFKPHETTKGTFSYMAPEVLLSAKPDMRADLYSMGVVFNYVLTRMNPFHSRTLEDARNNHLTVNALPPSDINSDVPKYFDAIVAKLLQKNPSDRYQFAVEVLRDINLSSPKHYEVETFESRFSYMPEGYLVGRRSQRTMFQDLIRDIKSPRHLSIKGASGVGKTRLLKDMKYTAELNDFEIFDLWDASETGVSFVVEGLAKAMLANPRPIMVAIDDLDRLLALHYSEPLMNLLEIALSRKDLKLILATTVASLPAVPWSKKGVIKEVPLVNFTKDEVREYLSSVAGVDKPLPQLLDQIYANTGGSPFMVAELVKTLIAEGMLVDSQGQWDETTFEDIEIDLGRLKMPTSVEDSLVGDILKLPTEARSFAEMLAVFGRPATGEEVSAVFADWPKVARLLLGKEIVRYDANEGKYSFVRPLAAQALYAQMSEDARAHWHDKIASRLWSSRLQPAPVESTEHLYHTSRGSDQLAAQSALKKLIELLTIAQRDHEAISHAQYYLERWDDPAMRLNLARLYNRICKYDLAIQTVSVIANPAHQLTALEITGISSLAKRDFAAARRYFQAALVIVSAACHPRESGDPVSAVKSSVSPPFEKGGLGGISFSSLQLRLENFLGDVFFFEGKFDNAIEIFERTSKEASGLPRKEQLEAMRNNNLGHAYLQKGLYNKAISELERVLKLYKEIDDKPAMTKACYSLAEAYRMEHAFDDASATFNKLIEHTRSTGDLKYLFRAYNGLGNLCNDQAKFAEAAAHCERALDVALRLGFNEEAVICVINLGVINSTSGDLKKAGEYFTTALAFLENRFTSSTLLGSYYIRLNLEMGDVLLRQKDLAGAEEHFMKADELASSSSDFKDILFWVKFTQTKLAAARKDAPSCKKLFAEASKLADTPEKQAKLKELNLE